MALPEQEAIREFVTVTGAEEERARFYLESADWDLELALGSFFEDGGDDVITLPQPESSSSSRNVPSDARVTSFRDLWNEEKDEEEDEGQRFYAGGSERSGQQIVGPPKKKNSNDVVEDLFKGAKEHGAVAVERAGRSPGEASKPKLWDILAGHSSQALRLSIHYMGMSVSSETPSSQAFGGGGYRLGAAEGEQSAYVTGERRPETAQDVHVVLKLWKSGFSVDDGELRNYTDPTNAQFLESIRRGEIPLELRRLARGGQVNLDMEDHRDQEYVKSKPIFKAFGGEGQKLGSATPQLVTTTTPAQQAEHEAKASSSVNLNESEPTTSIQIRLADGGRLVQKFNHTHRIQDVRHFIIDARPALAYTPFVLMTTFPSKELTDENETLKDANLLNAVIVQRLK